jgi:hypothetical protein
MRSDRTSRKLDLLRKLTADMGRLQKRWQVLLNRKARVTRTLWNDRKRNDTQ